MSKKTIYTWVHKVAPSEFRVLGRYTESRALLRAVRLGIQPYNLEKLEWTKERV